MNQHVEILMPLNSGGYGDVYLGRVLPRGTQVVVKYLRDYHLPHCRKAFEREVQILSRRLPGLIPVLFADLTAQPPYYVMPYLEAGALTQYAGRLGEHQLHAVATDLARTLAGLHAMFGADGDVKPDNVLVTDNGHLQLADPLGNGGLLTMLFSENSGGTPGYCAPEIRAGASISRAGDVFSFGATLYHLLTGRRPQDGQRPDPSSEGYRIAPKIREVISACCQWDPKTRPTMEEVSRMLAGESWADIQEQNRRVGNLVTGVFLFGIGLLGVAALAQGDKG